MVNEVAKATVQLDGAMAGAELKKLENRARELRSELVKLGKDNDLGGFRQKEKELKLVNNQMKNLKKSVWDVDQVLNKLNGSSLNELTRAQRQLSAEIKNMTRHTKEEVAAYNQKVEKLKQVNNEIQKVRHESVAAQNAQTNWFSKAAVGMNKYFGILSAGVATITGVVFSIKSFIQGNIELDDSLADVMKTTGLTKKEVRELYTEFRNLNTRTPRKELLALAEEAGRLGIEGKKNIMDFVEVANMIKVALGDDLAGNAEEAIREVGKLTEIYRVGEKYGVDFRQSMMMVGSSINEVSANSAANAPFLIDLTKRLAGVSSQAGISVQDIIGYAAALDEMGQSSEISATTLNKIIVQMFKDTETYAGLANLSIEEFNNLLNKDANEALIKVLEGLNGNNKGLSEMADKLDGLGLDGARSVQILAALAGNIELVRKNQDLANTSLEKGTSLSQEYQVKNNNMAGSMEKIGRAIKGAFINSGINEALSNIVSTVAKWVEIPVSQTMEEQRVKVNMLAIELSNANTQEERRRDIYEELKSLSPEIVEGIDKESISIDLLRENLAKYNQETIRKIALQRASEELSRVQEELGAKISARAQAEANLMKEMVKLRDQAEKWDKERASRIDDILVSSADIVDKEQQVNDVIEEINKNQRLNVIIGTNAANIAYDVKNLRQEENELLQKSNSELEKYQQMYKSIMGASGSMVVDSSVFGPGGGSSTATKTVTDNGTTPSGGTTSSTMGPDLAALADQQAAFRMRIIMESRTLTEQEQAEYLVRLNNAGIYMDEVGALTEEKQRVFEILTAEHQERLKKIQDNAMSEEILEQQKNFDEMTILRQTAHNNELAALGNNEEAKKALEAQFQKEELQRQQDFLVAMVAELQATLAGEDVFPSIDETLLSEEQKEALKSRINEILLLLSELQVKKSAITSGTDPDIGKQMGFAQTLRTDIFGMTQEDWVALIDNMREGNLTLQDTADIVGAISYAWSMYNEIRNNQEQQAMMDYESNVNKKKDLLEKQLAKGQISQETYNMRIQELEEDLDAKRREMAVKQAKREKSVALMGAIVNTALAVVKALTTQPVWLGIVMAALVGAMGGLQIAAIASQPIPQYASGRYDVIGQQDGKTYRAGMKDSARTGLINEPTILVGEKPEIIIDPYTTRNLQMNYPEVIEAINAARVPQFASGSFGTVTREKITERELPKEFYELMAITNENNRRLSSILERGIPAKLVADGDYVQAHNDVMDNYNLLRDQVDLKG